MYKTSAANNLPIIEHSSIEILPANYESYNKPDYIPKWYVEHLYTPIKISDIRENKHLLNLYINCICNILQNAYCNNITYSDWKIDNVVYDANFDKIILADFDFIPLNNEILSHTYDTNSLIDFVAMYALFNNIIDQKYINKQISSLIALYDILNIYNCITENIDYKLDNINTVDFCSIVKKPIVNETLAYMCNNKIIDIDYSYIIKNNQNNNIKMPNIYYLKDITQFDTGIKIE